MNISPMLSLDVSIHSPDDATRATIQEYTDMIVNLARLKSISVENTGQRPKSAATSVVEDATIFVSLEGIIDFEKEIQRLEKEINKLTLELTKISKKLNNEDFLGKAPEHVVEKVKDKHEAFIQKQQNLQMHLDKIKALDD
jgi:valyl-tRNA synthetase